VVAKVGSTEAARVAYEYYTSTQSGRGMAGDLKRVTVTMPLSAGVSQTTETFYRYYTSTGYEHCSSSRSGRKASGASPLIRTTAPRIRRTTTSSPTARRSSSMGVTARLARSSSTQLAGVPLEAVPASTVLFSREDNPNYSAGSLYTNPTTIAVTHTGRPATR